METHRISLRILICLLMVSVSETLWASAASDQDTLEEFHVGFAQELLSERQHEISTIQELLKPDEVLVEYTFRDTTFTVMIISKLFFTFYHRNVSHEFLSRISEYRRKVKLADINKQAELSHQLYLILVGSIREMFVGKKRLIIIPCKELQGIPFEALVVGGNRKGKIPSTYGLHYLIQDFEITYQISIGLWMEMYARTNCIKESELVCQIDFSGFSPCDFQNPGITSLPFSKNELYAVARLFQQKGMTFSLNSYSDSKEITFRKVAGRSKIIHLASHCHRKQGNSGEEGVIFWDYNMDATEGNQNDGMLSSREVASLKLKADLMVISTCSSGMVPMPQGFIQAGVKNVISALWNVSDRLAFHFMIGFYQKWLSGKTFSEALREQKLELLQCRETSLPTLWASYILIGQ